MEARLTGPSWAVVLLGMHVVSKHSVDSGLISLAMPAKKTKYIGVQTQGNLLLLSRPTNGVLEKIGTEFRAFREINR
jgi:hypothetical protein